MFEDLRRDADASPFEEEDPYKVAEAKKPNFLGMTPAQRFILSLMILLITCLIGIFGLLVTEKIVLPFL